MPGAHPGDSLLGGLGWALQIILLLGRAWEPRSGHVVFWMRLCSHPWSSISHVACISLLTGLLALLSPLQSLSSSWRDHLKI